ncbi:VOC family protein [Paenibacillus sp. J5C_2022]|uniref:VOC family protein n=1 Tax=Paenibacillus sp. J5C2022 TaxID=2977129 RepID=UPI0021CFF18E|nr:VOC family protein [Paenibacillus sp. J5C2022]MCU6711734.1 VOC family protein [Paenibacillus sp. J5C2022]
MSAKLHPGIALGEVELRVSDLQRSIQFYKDIIGLQVLQQDADSVRLTADGRKTLVVLQAVPNATVTPPRSFSGLYHFAILLPDRKHLAVTARHLMERGVAIGQADHAVSEALYLSDPDHNGIEIYRDRPRSEWKYDDQGGLKMGTDPIHWESLLEEANGQQWEGLPSGTTIGHVHLHVGDMAEARRYFCDAVGFSVEADMMRSMGALFVAAGGYHHHLGLNIWAGVHAPPVPDHATGISSFTILFPDDAALKETVERLQRMDVHVEPFGDGDGWMASSPWRIAIKLSVQ